MLQQTRVETVIPYYKEWMRRFPNVDALASAPEEEVLRVWQGLGYYSRARNLHGAARMVKESLGGKLPTSSSELQALPGVGDYTAGAVASIAFGEVVPAVDGNVRRVLSRLFDLPDPGLPELRGLAGTLVDPVRPGDFNQALMELGALVCTPRAPRCESCPFEDICLARERGTEAQRPMRKDKRPVPVVEIAVVVAIAGAADTPRLLLRKRPGEGLLAGMWEFPGVEIGRGEDPEPVASALAVDLGVVAGGRGPMRERPGFSQRKLPATVGGEAGSEAVLVPLEPVIHTFTHLKARYRPFLVRLPAVGDAPSAGHWLSVEEIDDVPLPVAQGRILGSALYFLNGQVV
jgi:A/G-specific adenine glycosylase